VSPVVVGPVSGLPAGTDGFPWWNDTVFYQVFVRSFYDGDGDGDGDLPGLIAKLDYLNDGDPTTTTDLGVTGLWLMPIFESPSYHGYDVTDYYTVNPDYGTNDDFKQLMAEAHARGIRVIVDFVLNHTSNRHPWFQDAQTPGSAHRDWYIWKDQSPGYAGPWGQTVWHYAGSTSGYYYGIFVASMPDLNYANSAVSEQMEDVARFWLTEMGADGFRLDGARHLIEEDRNQADTNATHAWYRGFRQFYKGVNPEAVAVGEVWTGNAAVAAYVQGDELDLAFNFDMAGGFLKAARTGGAMDANTQLLLANRLFPPGQYATFLSNHDQERVMTQLDGDGDQARHAAALLLTAPGVPFVYYGEEIGMKGAKPDEKIRTPMQWSAEAGAGFSAGAPWQAPNSDYETTNVAAQTDDPASLLSLYRALIRLRAEHAALRLGEAEVVRADHPGVYALLRATPQETILAVINLTAEPVSDYGLDLEAGPLAGDYAVAPLLGEGAFYAPAVSAQGGFTRYRPLPTLEANGIYILQLQTK
jgi:glycosidase